MNQDLRTVEKRTLSYWFEDGIWDISFGLALLVMGLFYVLIAVLRLEGTLGMVLPMVQMALIITVFLFIGRLVKFLKERITYPRTGQLVYRKPSNPQRMMRLLRSALFGALFAALMAVVASLPSMHDRTSAIAGGLLGLASFFLGLRFGILRYYFIGLVTILAGLGISLVRGSFINMTGFFFCVLGLIWMAAGGLALWRYLRSTQLSSAEVDVPGPTEEL